MNSSAQRFSQQVVLVTGASSGIGLATVRAFSKEGAKVVLAARREGKLNSIAGELRDNFNTETLVVPTNVREFKQVKHMVNRAVEIFSRLDIVVNNAGVDLGSDVESLEPDKYKAITETNINGTFYTTKETLPHLKRSSGNLIFVGSFAGQYPRSFNPVYAATKWWVRGFAHSLEAQVGKDGIGISVVNPSEVRTEIGSDRGQSLREKYEEGEITEPEEIAEVITFAASQKHSTISEVNIYRRDKLAQF